MSPIVLGDFKLHLLSDGMFRLDGGAMYGVVPKTLWERQSPPDERNRVSLNLGCLLIQTPKGRNILVDTGLSSKYDDNKKFLSMFAVERPSSLRAELAALGLAPSDIHVVINTHLHFDHAGGNTDRQDGKLALQFPKAKYVVQKEEWEDAQTPHERNKASYLEENFAPLQDSGALELVSGDAVIEPGVRVVNSGGHTRGHQCVRVDAGGKTAFYFGDLIPTRSHVPLPWIMGYDLFPVHTLEMKRELLKKAKEEEWTLLFQHDPQRRSGVLREAEGREAVVPV